MDVCDCTVFPSVYEVSEFGMEGGVAEGSKRGPDWRFPRLPLNSSNVKLTPPLETPNLTAIKSLSNRVR